MNARPRLTARTSDFDQSPDASAGGRKIFVASLLRPTGPTGVQSHMATFARWLESRGVPCEVCTPFSAQAWQIVPTIGIRTLITRISKDWSVRWYRAGHAYFLRKVLRQRLAGGEPCIIYAQCPVSARVALEARTSPTQRVVLVVHFNKSQADEWAGKGMIAPTGATFRNIRLLEQDVLPKLDALVFVSEFMLDAVAARIPAINGVPTVVIPNFVDVPGQEAVPGPASDLLLIATLEPRKNQAYALDIVAAARSRGRDLTLRLIGEGPDRTALKKAAVTLGIDDLVTIEESQPDAARQFRRCRAALLVSIDENLPLVIPEAMARGKPVFTTPVGGIPEIVRDGAHGAFIPLNDASRAAQIICDWFESPNRLSAAGKSSKEYFLRHLETQRIASRIFEFIQKA